MRTINIDVEKSLHQLTRYVEDENYRGYDPYDALESSVLKRLSSRSKFIRILFIQAFKRLPVNLRPVFGIRKGLNPKGLGLFLGGYARLYAITGDKGYLGKINLILNLLEETKSREWSGNCWGYNFDWQSRAFYVPKYTPTIVNSAFIGHALIDAYRMTGISRTLDMARSIPRFILRDLNVSQFDGDTICFSYTPIDRLAVHNANLLGASMLIRMNDYEPGEPFRKSAHAALNYSLSHQHADGSWYYAETAIQKWIDSFHTGFNLQAISYFLDSEDNSLLRKKFEKGMKFYRNYFFLEDGTPKYYHDRIYPIDIHSPAQALFLFSKIGGPYKRISARIARWMLANMQDRRGYFYFQKYPLFTNRIAYIRWGQAWAFHALTAYQHCQVEK